MSFPSHPRPGAADPYDILVVGAGPAGSAAAIQIAERAPERAQRTLLIDGAVFPREKLCGGGVVREADALLACLGVKADVPSVPIHELRFQYAGGSAVLPGENLFRVVRREEFDAFLLDEARSRGVVVREGEPVVRVWREPDRVCVETKTGARYAGRVLIGADGARSLVRRRLVGGVRTRRFVALEVLTPGHDGAEAGGSTTAVFDFRPAAAGLRGYRWHFPSIRRGDRVTNRGVMGAIHRGAPALEPLLDVALNELGHGLGRGSVQGAGAPLYDPTRPQGAERVLLAGDAVGIDPWFGEGISVAIGTGIIAAHTAIASLASGCFDFRNHADQIRRSAVGRSLLGKCRAASAFYGMAARKADLGALLRAERAA